MAIHPDRDIIATGQMAGKPRRDDDKANYQGGKLVTIFVWRASTREVIAEIRGFHRRAVR